MRFYRELFLTFFSVCMFLSKAQQPSGSIDMYQVEKERYQYLLNRETGEQKKPATQQTPFALPAYEKTAQTTTAVPFTTLTSVSDVSGLIQSECAPLQYNNDLNTITMFLRKGPGYTASPSNTSGAVVAFIGTNFGTSWDSTCIWSNSTYGARMTQGGILNPTGNTLTTQGVLVGMGPVTNNLGNYLGNFYASKTMSVAGTNSPGADAQMIASNAPTYAANQGRHSYSRNNFSATDDGRMRSMAGVINDPTNLLFFQPRGVALATGVFNAGAFVWTVDTFCPPLMTKTNNDRYINPSGYQAWNESGSVGYVVMLGIKAGAVGANRGQQPIIYKTTNSGNSWSAVPGIDFNSPSYYKILNALSNAQGQSCLPKPYFKHDEGIACVVDGNNRLHIYSTIASTASDLQDSLFNVYKYGTEGYSWRFVPGYYPTIYDFYGDGAGPWQVNVIDSLGSQGPGWKTNQPGYNDNPWDADPSNSNVKVPCGSRIQAGRSADGQFIMLCYAQSDTNFTVNSRKWNSLPDLMVKAWGNSSNKVYERLSITTGMGQTAQIAKRSQMHYLAPSVASFTAPGSLTFTAPITVANSFPYSQLTANRVWLSKAVVTFTNAAPSPLASGTLCAVALKENQKNNFGFELFPNPTENEVSISLYLDPGNGIEVSIKNILGEEIVSRKNIMERNFRLDISSLAKGTYFISIGSGKEEQTKKLIRN